MIHIPNIQLKLLRPADRIAPMALCPTCNPRANLMPSRLLFGVKRQIFVNRSASGNRFPSASRSSVMVLNLTTLNIFPFLPGRSCKKKAPAPLLAKCSQMVMTSSIGHRIANVRSERMKSITLFQKSWDMINY